MAVSFSAFSYALNIKNEIENNQNKNDKEIEVKNSANTDNKKIT